MAEIAVLRDKCQGNVPKFPVLRDEDEDFVPKFPVLRDEDEDSVPKFLVLRDEDEDFVPKFPVLRDEDEDFVPEFLVLRDEDAALFSKRRPFDEGPSDDGALACDRAVATRYPKPGEHAAGDARRVLDDVGAIGSLAPRDVRDMLRAHSSLGRAGVERVRERCLVHLPLPEDRRVEALVTPRPPLHPRPLSFRFHRAEDDGTRLFERVLQRGSNILTGIVTSVPKSVARFDERCPTSAGGPAARAFRRSLDAGGGVGRLGNARFQQLAHERYREGTLRIEVQRGLGLAVRLQFSRQRPERSAAEGEVRATFARREESRDDVTAVSKRGHRIADALLDLRQDGPNRPTEFLEGGAPVGADSGEVPVDRFGLRGHKKSVTTKRVYMSRITPRKGSRRR